MFRGADAAMFLMGGLLTLGVFTSAIIYLRQIAKQMEVEHVYD